jgi:hypothetical protein
LSSKENDAFQSTRADLKGYLFLFFASQPILYLSVSLILCVANFSLKPNRFPFVSRVCFRRPSPRWHVSINFGEGQNKSDGRDMKQQHQHPEFNHTNAFAAAFLLSAGAGNNGRIK